MDQWPLLVPLGSAFVLSALIGLEREYRNKAAGLRTYTVVGLSAALFVLVSKFGFADVVQPGRVVLDPSRVAAQVVSGIGFIGGGIIFVRRDAVRGLTTAASVWFAAGVGMACGAGLPLLALAATLGHFIIMFSFRMLEARMPRAPRVITAVSITYRDGTGMLRGILMACEESGFRVERMAVSGASNLIELTLGLRGRQAITGLLARLGALEGVQAVRLDQPEPA